MKQRLPSELVITAEMDETGLNRLQAIRRIQQRQELRARITTRPVSQSPGGAPLYFVPAGESL